MKIAVQSFGLQKEFATDFRGTLQVLHEMGFAGVEPLVLLREEQGKTQKNTWAFDTLRIACEAMKDLEMTIPSVHLGVGYKWTYMPIKKIVQGILKIHEISGADTYVISGLFDTPALARHWAKITSKIQEAVKPYGCRILYHNHSGEFAPLRRGGTAMDAFLAHVSPDVNLQVDIGWVGSGNSDESEIIKHYGDRIASLHLKDFYPQYRGVPQHKLPDEAFAPIGAGAIHTKEILALTPAFPRFHDPLIIDQDKSGGPMLDDLKIGMNNLKKMLEA